VELDELDELLRDAVERESRLTEWEYEFVKSTVLRRNRYGDETRISEKQEAVLRRIEKKVYGT
jgi:hypothetical protein